MSQPLTLVSHLLCPYVQRAAIALGEKGVPFERIVIDLAKSPSGFSTSRRWARCLSLRCSARTARRPCCSRAT